MRIAGRTVSSVSWEQKLPLLKLAQLSKGLRVLWGGPSDGHANLRLLCWFLFYTLRESSLLGSCFFTWVCVASVVCPLLAVDWWIAWLCLVSLSISITKALFSYLAL